MTLCLWQKLLAVRRRPEGAASRERDGRV